MMDAKEFHIKKLKEIGYGEEFIKRISEKYESDYIYGFAEEYLKFSLTAPEEDKEECNCNNGCKRTDFSYEYEECNCKD